MKQFCIEEEYLTDVWYHHVTYTVDMENPSPEDLIKILKGNHKWELTGSRDHIEFTKLRDLLEETGHIQTQRGWNNGDCVLKDFMLNDVLFEKGDQFCCGAAIKGQMKSKRKHQMGL